jgi:hypothetical protein
MLWEKKSSLKQKRGYLYIRETIYQRDGRTLKRKAPKLGDGSASKERWKYSKKIDIYCGKIIEDIELKHFISFKEYISQIKQLEFLEYKTSKVFSELLEDFIEYLLYSHELDKEEFFEGKKAAYAISSGYLSREGIEFLRRFNVKQNPLLSNEIERFANRCLDIGIYDDEIIMLLYMKLLPSEDAKSLEQELEDKFEELEIQNHKSYGDFIRKEHNK